MLVPPRPSPMCRAQDKPTVLPPALPGEVSRRPDRRHQTMRPLPRRESTRRSISDWLGPAQERSVSAAQVIAISQRIAELGSISEWQLLGTKLALAAIQCCIGTVSANHSRDPVPSTRTVHAPQRKIGWPSCLSRLHLSKSWSRRQAQRSSYSCKIDSTSTCNQRFSAVR
jgi:hypothetical protein